MSKLIFLVVLEIMCSLAITRGPHHPRGEKIVKHHVHYRPTKGNTPSSENLIQDEQLIHDKEHIREDLGEWVQEKDIASMSDEELEFHYFQLHDFDNNSRLDGLEILQAIHHTVHHDDEEEAGDLPEKQSDIDYYVEMIDQVLAEDDVDWDGYLSYPEYVAGKKRHLETKTFNDLVVPPKAVLV